MMRCLISLVALAAIPASAFAAAPAATPAAAAAAAKPAPVPLVPTTTRRVTLSPEGNAIAAKIAGVQDPRVAQIRTEMASIVQDKLRILNGPAIDIDKLEALLKREDALQSEFRGKQNERLITLLRALSEADRIVLLQNLANPVRPQAAKPATTGR